MIDEYKRKIDYVRISVTDRCNLRCAYCMPREGASFAAEDSLLTDEEIISLCSCFADLGLRKFKITGGEPLVRQNISCLIRKLKEIKGVETVTLTTNGVFLAEQMEELVKAGIDAVNISLDTLSEEKFKELTGFGELKRVKAGIQKALEYKNIPVKINCVPLRKYNDEESILSMAALAQKARLHVRFIEVMPIGKGKSTRGYSEDEIKEILMRKFGQLLPSGETLGNGPGKYYDMEGFQGKIGFISAVSHGFCAGCNRVRLTSAGILKGCLHYGGGIDLKKALKEGKSREDMKELIREAIRQKPERHLFYRETAIGKELFEDKGMSQIGG